MLAQVGFYPATGQTDRIVIHPVACTEAEGTAPFLHNPQEALQIPTPRQTHSAEKEEPCLSLCDFVAPEGYQDYIGAFAVTVSPSFVEELEATKQTDDYRALLLQSVETAWQKLPANGFTAKCAVRYGAMHLTKIGPCPI